MLETHDRNLPCTVTGLGVLASVGLSAPEFRAALARGECGIRPIEAFATEAFTTNVAGALPGGWEARWEAYLAARKDKLLHDLPEAAIELATKYALLAAAEAWEDANAQDANIDPARVGLVVGTSMTGMWVHEELREISPSETARRSALLPWRRCQAHTALLAQAMDIQGPRATFVSACTASTNALGFARDLLTTGQADIVLVGGMDALSRSLFGGFYALGAMCPQACSPFSEPYGMTLGEGAGFIVLERPDEAAARGQQSLGQLLGYGLASDCFHASSPDPSGKGFARSITTALQDAGITPDDVGYYNAHGTGTEANDAAEWQALMRVFGDAAHQLPVSATKSYFGHAQGAAGALETVATLMALQDQVFLPTLGFTTPRRPSPTDPVAAAHPRPGTYQYALKHSAAFGGANTTLVLGSASARMPPQTPRTSPQIAILGVGAVGPHGVGPLEELSATTGRVPPKAHKKLLRHTDLRDHDNVTHFLTTAASEALQVAGVRIRGGLRDKAGLIAAIGGAGPVSADLFLDSIAARGAAKGATTAFVRSTLNASSGAAAMVLSLRGLNSTFAGSGLTAAIYAAMMLENRDNTSLIIAAGADERTVMAEEEHDALAHRGSFAGEGAACIVLGRVDQLPKGASPQCLLTGWGLAGPRHLDHAIKAAIGTHNPDEIGLIVCASAGTQANIDAEAVALKAIFGNTRDNQRIHPAHTLGYAPAATSAFGMLIAVKHLQSNQATSPAKALVVVTDQDTGSAAALLETYSSTTIEAPNVHQDTKSQEASHGTTNQ